MKLLATYLAMAWTFGVHAQGLIWSINQNSIAGNGEGAGPVPNREIGFDHVPTPFYTQNPPSLNPVSGIFSMTITTNDAGRTFFAKALNEPGFTGFTAGLTDGANGYLRLQDLSFLTWGVGREASVLGRPAATPDFAGYYITQVGFHVNSYFDWFYEPENRYLNTLDYSLDFYGAAVPEPSIWALLGLGSALLWPALRRRGK